MSNECSPTCRRHAFLVSSEKGEKEEGRGEGKRTLFFAHFESQLRGLFEVPTIPNSKFKMRNNFFSQRGDDLSREGTANRNKKQVDQFNSMLLETRREWP